jgi:DNA-binding transcriptional LysR family regulator
LPENRIFLDTLYRHMDNRSMEWRDWELFCEVVEHGGFSAAARVLGHPKSTLSAAVQRLESNLGLRLIERTTRHLRLTEAGDTIYRRVRPLFTALHDTHSEALAMSSVIAGTLRIKSPYEFGAHHAGPVACELMGRYPDLAIRIDVEHDIVNPVAENYDIVFAMLEAPHPAAEIIIRRVFSLERGLFAAPALLEDFGEPRTLEDLAKLPLLTGPNDAPWPITTPGGTLEHLGSGKPGSPVRMRISDCRRRSPGTACCGSPPAIQVLRSKPDCCGAFCRTISASRLACTRCFRRANSCPPRFDVSWMRWKPMRMAARRRRPSLKRRGAHTRVDVQEDNPAGLIAALSRFWSRQTE